MNFIFWHKDVAHFRAFKHRKPVSALLSDLLVVEWFRCLLDQCDYLWCALRTFDITRAQKTIFLGSLCLNSVLSTFPKAECRIMLSWIWLPWAIWTLEVYPYHYLTHPGLLGGRSFYSRSTSNRDKWLGTPSTLFTRAPPRWTFSQKPPVLKGCPSLWSYA